MARCRAFITIHISHLFCVHAYVSACVRVRICCLLSLLINSLFCSATMWNDNCVVRPLINFVSFGFVSLRFVAFSRSSWATHASSSRSCHHDALSLPLSSSHSFSARRTQIYWTTKREQYNIRSNKNFMAYGQRSQPAICIKEVKLKLLRTLIDACGHFFRRSFVTDGDGSSGAMTMST